MAEYKQPKTRVKVVEDGFGKKFYPQYHVVFIPLLLQGWEPILGGIGNEEYVPSLGCAQERIEEFLRADKHYWASELEKKARKKVKKKVSIIKYP